MGLSRPPPQMEHRFVHQMPRPDSLITEAQPENFTRECETWINLELHPHIVSCFYVRNLDGAPRVFAELVEGGQPEGVD